MGTTDTGSQHVIWWSCLVHIQDGDYKPDRYRSQKLLLQLLLTKGDPVIQLFSVASSWYDRGWHSGVELECVWGRLDRLLCLMRPKQSWQWVTFYDPWPTWPICQLTSDPRDPWPMTHDYSPVTVTVWRLRTLGKVSMRFWFHTVLCLYALHNKINLHQLIFLP